MSAEDPAQTSRIGSEAISDLRNADRCELAPSSQTTAEEGNSRTRLAAPLSPRPHQPVRDRHGRGAYEAALVRAGQHAPDLVAAEPAHVLERVPTVKKAVKRSADRAELPQITQKTPRTFMNTMVRKLCRDVTREQRSLWLGHTVREGSRTTDFYDIEDAEYHADTALATDYVLQRLRTLCKSDFAVEVLLKPAELKRIGADKIVIPRGK